MSLRCNGLILVFVLGAVFFEAQVAEAKTRYYHKAEPTCPFHPDFSTVESSLRSNIFLAKTERAAETLSSNELFSLAAGFTYSDNETCLVVQTSMRARDPDIVAAQALALSAGTTGETEKLARAIVLSFEIECQCSLFTAKEKDELAADFKAVLDDPKERKIILEFGRPKEPYMQHYVSNTTYGTHFSGRRLSATETSPVNSKVCAYCDPPNLCKDVRWCK